MEEQFYVLWPPLLAWLGARRGLRAVAAFAIVAPLLRVTIYLVDHGTSLYLLRGFEVVGDAIAAGCLLALCREALWARGWYRRLLASWWIVPVALAAVAGHLVQNHPLLYYGAGITATNLCIALLLDWAVRAPTGRASAAVHRALNLRPVVFVGTLSYSLYVWQQPFFDYGQSAAWQRFPQNALLAVVAALASYYAIERPMLRFRSWLERRRVLRVQGATADALDAAAAP